MGLASGVLRVTVQGLGLRISALRRGLLDLGLQGFGLIFKAKDLRISWLGLGLWDLQFGPWA